MWSIPTLQALEKMALRESLGMRREKFFFNSGRNSKSSHQCMWNYLQLQKVYTGGSCVAMVANIFFCYWVIYEDHSVMVFKCMHHRSHGSSKIFYGNTKYILERIFNSMEDRKWGSKCHEEDLINGFVIQSSFYLRGLTIFLYWFI